MGTGGVELWQILDPLTGNQGKEGAPSSCPSPEWNFHHVELVGRGGRSGQNYFVLVFNQLCKYCPLFGVFNSFILNATAIMVKFKSNALLFTFYLSHFYSFYVLLLKFSFEFIKF